MPRQARNIHLPIEVFLLILAQVENLFPFMLLNKAVKTAVTRMAYSRVSLHHPWEAPIDQLPAIVLLLRTLKTRPDLAGYIKHLRVEFIDLLSFHDIAEDLETLSVDAAERGLPAEIQLGIRTNRMGALLFLLLSHIPALQTFDINPFKSGDTLFFRSISHAPIPTGLQSLRSLSISSAALAIPVRKILFPFPPIPSLSTIRCTNPPLNPADLDDDDDDDYDADDDDDDEDSMGVTGSGLEDIYLKRAEVDEPMLRALITSSRGVRSVVILDICIPLLAPPTTSTLGPILREYSLHSLRTLKLEYHSGIPYFCPLGSVRDFSRLRTISCRIGTLLGVASPTTTRPDLRTMFPPSLTTLWLWIDLQWADAGCGTSLLQLVEEKQAAVPLLKHMYLGGYMEYAEWEMLVAACKNARVGLTYKLELSGMPLPQGLMDGSPLSNSTPPGV